MKDKIKEILISKISDESDAEELANKIMGLIADEASKLLFNLKK